MKRWRCIDFGGDAREGSEGRCRGVRRFVKFLVREAVREGF